MMALLTEAFTRLQKSVLGVVILTLRSISFRKENTSCKNSGFRRREEGSRFRVGSNPVAVVAPESLLFLHRALLCSFWKPDLLSLGSEYLNHFRSLIP